jgi:hypothetical protein
MTDPLTGIEHERYDASDSGVEWIVVHARVNDDAEIHADIHPGECQRGNKQ